MNDDRCGARPPKACGCYAGCSCVIMGGRHTNHVTLCGARWSENAALEPRLLVTREHDGLVPGPMPTRDEYAALAHLDIRHDVGALTEAKHRGLLSAEKRGWVTSGAAPMLRQWKLTDAGRAALKRRRRA